MFNGEKKGKLDQRKKSYQRKIHGNLSILRLFLNILLEEKKRLKTCNESNKCWSVPLFQVVMLSRCDIILMVSPG